MSSTMYSIIIPGAVGAIGAEVATQLQSRHYFILGDLKSFDGAKTIAAHLRDFSLSQPINRIWQAKSCSGQRRRTMQ